ncbi:hypothetical protein Tco_1333740, partial [Tanacetum coccineum]
MTNLTTLSLSFWDYALETATRILNMVPTKKGLVSGICLTNANKGSWLSLSLYDTQDKNLLSQEISGRAEELEEVQDKDTSPSENTSEIPMEVEGFEPPQEEVFPVRRSARTHQAPDRLCLTIEVKHHSLGDLNEPNNYKAAILDLESDKWVDAINSVDYQEMFSPVADIRAIRILIAIAAFYDYEIWKVCKLQRSIYGLKQASRSWNKRFDEEIKRFGFAQNLDEPWEAAFIHGIKIYRDTSKRLIRLSQSAYMDKILKIFSIDTSKRGYIPMKERLDLNKTQGASTPEEVK